ncbi:MAG: polysaccharide deacetylase family protein [Smithella sp.]|jgi:peptidoglycan/xylan/chitin deacetylase (PgdA/CDA1 family)
MPKIIIRIIKLIISLFVFLFDRISERLQSLFNEDNATCVILYYHTVYPEEAELFNQQMDDLLCWTKPVAINEIGALKSPGRYCAVTFDDGFVCVLENGLPEMAKRNIPATLFVPSGCLGQQPPWLDERNPDHKNVVMTTAQLKSLDKKLVLIGSHGRSHSNLLQIDIEEAKKEIFQSKRELEDALNRTIETISFPHGDFNQAHVNMAIQAGYKNAYSILPEPIHSGSDSFIRGRVKVDPFDWRIEYRLKLLGAYRWLPMAFTLKRSIHKNFN